MGGGLEKAHENLGFQDDVADVESRELMDGQVPLAVDLPPPFGVADNEVPVGLGHVPNPETSDPLEPVDNPLRRVPGKEGIELAATPRRVLDPSNQGGPLLRVDPSTGNARPNPDTITPPAREQIRLPTPKIGRGGALPGANRENWEEGVSPPRMESPGDMPPSVNSPAELDPYSAWVDQLIDKGKNKKGKGKSGKKGEDRYCLRKGAEPLGVPALSQPIVRPLQGPVSP